MSHPGKHPEFIIHSTSPLNGGTPPELLRGQDLELQGVHEQFLAPGDSHLFRKRDPSAQLSDWPA